MNIKIGIYYADIIERYLLNKFPFCSSLNTMYREHSTVAWQPFFKKDLFRHRRNDERIIIEIDKILGKPLYPVEVKLYRMRAESGEIFFGDIILVADDIELRVTCVQPLGDMPPGDKMYLSTQGANFSTPLNQ